MKLIFVQMYQIDEVKEFFLREILGGSTDFWSDVFEILIQKNVIGSDCNPNKLAEMYFGFSMFKLWEIFLKYDDFPKAEIEIMFDLKDLMSRVNLPQDITRRGFLQVATVTAAFAAMNQSRAQTGAQPYIILETPKGLIVGDPSLCVDCQRCEMACTEFNDGKNDPVLARIRIGRNIWYGPGNPGARPLQGVWGDSTVYQDTCRQCAHPVPCANACPQGAIRVDPKTGARYVDEDKCIGCGLCQKACPWDMMSFDREKQKASKCFLCDGEPKCVKACPAAALTYMPWKDRSGEPARRPTHGYLPEENANQCSVCHG